MQRGFSCKWVRVPPLQQTKKQKVMVTMRDLSQVEDIRLGCLFQPDERNFAAAPVVQDRPQQKWTW